MFPDLNWGRHDPVCRQPEKAGVIHSIMNLETFKWLEGRWVGEIDGDPVEEHWSPAVAGQMTATFRWLKSGKPWLYEWILLGEFNGKIQMRLKHFNPDACGWEEKDAWTEFTLESLAGMKAAFRQTNKADGPLLMIERKGSDLRTWFESESGRPPVAGVFTYRLT